MSFLTPDDTPTRNYKRAHAQKVIDIRAIENARARSSSFTYPDLEDAHDSDFDTDSDEQPVKKKLKQKKTLAQRMMNRLDGDDESEGAMPCGGGKRHPGTGELLMSVQKINASNDGKRLGRKDSFFKAPTPLRASASASSITEVSEALDTSW